MKVSINSIEPTSIINDDDATDNRFIHNNNKSSINLDYNQSYHNLSLEETFILRYSDPINSIALTDNYVLFGSMIGKVILYNISKKHFYTLYELANENIMGSSLENKIDNKLVHYIAIGDESIVSIFEKENEKDIEANTIYNYEEKENHEVNCKNNFTLLWKNKALIVNIYVPEKNTEEIEYKKNSYILFTYNIEDKKKDLTEEGFIEMSNYCVPFDYKDNIFLFLDHLPNEKRDICIYEFKNNENGKKSLITIDKNFGHISFLKIINKNMILMVRNYNQIEIYNFEKEFKMIASLKNQYEINDIDFYEIKNKDNENEENEDNLLSTNANFIQYNIIYFDVEQNIFELKFKNGSSRMELIYSNNIKNIKGISNELKMKRLFDLDFPYYIRNSQNFIALTSDQACFLFKKEK